jgi:hypothetical protein
MVRRDEAGRASEPFIACLAVLAYGCATGKPAPPSGAASAVASSTAPGGDAADSAGPPPDPSADAAASSRDLRFRGTVASIDSSRADELSNRNWVVSMKVEQVLAGELSGKMFAFRIHSPSKSGLVVGGSYTVEAKWTGDGYSVDQYQWRRR